MKSLLRDPDNFVWLWGLEALGALREVKSLNNRPLYLLFLHNCLSPFFSSTRPSSHPCTPGMPTCLLCTCLGGSVYCDDLKLDSVPPLPKDTTHFYARYNRITKINKSDFASMSMFPFPWMKSCEHQTRHRPLVNARCLFSPASRQAEENRLNRQRDNQHRREGVYGSAQPGGAGDPRKSHLTAACAPRDHDPDRCQPQQHRHQGSAQRGVQGTCTLLSRTKALNRRVNQKCWPHQLMWRYSICFCDHDSI